VIPADVALLCTPGTPALHPDGRTAIFSVLSPDPGTDEYVGHLWRVPTDGSSAPVPLTRGHRDTAPTCSPDRRWIAFLRAEAKGRPQLHLVEADGGEPVRLTDAPLGVSDPRFSPDGTRIAYLARVPAADRYLTGGDSSAEAPRHITTVRYRADNVGFVRDRPQHLFAVDVPIAPRPGRLSEPVALTAGDLEVTGHRWLPDGRRIVAVGAVHPGREADLRVDALLVDAHPDEGGPVAPRPLTDAARGSTLSVETVLPSPDGRTLWLLAGDLGIDGLDFIAAQTGLWSLDLGTLAAQEGGDPPPPRRHTDAEVVDLVPGLLVLAGQEVLVADQRRGAVTLLTFPADPTAAGSSVARVLLDSPAVVHGVAATPDGATVVVSAGGPDTVGDLVAVDLASGGATPLTDLSAELRATGRLHQPHELTATAPDGYPVHGWVTAPDPARHGAGPHPVVLMIHGGPFAQFTHELFDEVQVLVEAGYAVVHGNPRGSSGCGAAHGRAITHAFGTVDADDVLALLDAALAGDPGLDADRLGVMGGSYGGYLSAWLTTRTDRFAAAVVERGFLDPVSFVGSCDIGWFFGLAYLGDNDTDAASATLAAQSPMAHVGRVRTPTLVIHSEDDWRCPVEQGQRWFVELKRRGVPAELLLFPGEGHELTRSGRPSHRVARFVHLLDWWSRQLRS